MKIGIPMLNLEVNWKNLYVRENPLRVALTIMNVEFEFRVWNFN